jgi:hypothetical protein
VITLFLNDFDRYKLWNYQNLMPKHHYRQYPICTYLALFSMSPLQSHLKMHSVRGSAEPGVVEPQILSSNVSLAVAKPGMAYARSHSDIPWADISEYIHDDNNLTA